MQLPIRKEVRDEGFVSIVDASGDPWFEGTGFGSEGAAAGTIVRAVNMHDELVAALRNLEVSANSVRQADAAACPENFAAALAQMGADAKDARAALSKLELPK